MKKFFLIIVIILLLSLSLVYAFSRPTFYDYDTLKTTTDTFYINIASIVDKYDYEIKDISKTKNEFKKCLITVNKKQTITVDFTNEKYEDTKRYGSFSVSYTISDIDDKNFFDVQFFTRLVNLFSGKSVSEEFVLKFLAAPADDYPPSDYGLDGNTYSVEKLYALDFFENWFIGYNLTSDGYAELWFSGYIK